MAVITVSNSDKVCLTVITVSAHCYNSEESKLKLTVVITVRVRVRVRVRN